MSATANSTDKKPVCLIMIGMAGAGKTSFVQRLNSYLNAEKKKCYTVNLDPACLETPYPCNIDIRDTVNYKEVMKQYSLGPNGAIITSLNLFSTKFEQVMNLIEKRSDQIDYCLFDTPGQIEVFSWSASGSILTQSLGSTFPTIIVYVLDTARNVSPITFMSNMLYACSILYKTKLPFVIVMNKNDIIHHSFVGEWMKNFESFQNALENETSYVSNLTRSLSIVLEEFYENIKFVGVSSTTGAGLSDFVKTIDLLVDEYERNYKAEFQKMSEKREALEKQRQEAALSQVVENLKKNQISNENDSETIRVSSDEADEMQEKQELESLKRFLSSNASRTKTS